MEILFYLTLTPIGQQIFIDTYHQDMFCTAVEMMWKLPLALIGG